MELLFLKLSRKTFFFYLCLQIFIFLKIKKFICYNCILPIIILYTATLKKVFKIIFKLDRIKDVS